MKYTHLPADGTTIGEVLQVRGEGRTSIASSSYVRRGKTLYQLFNSCSFGWGEWTVVQTRCLEVAI